MPYQYVTSVHRYRDTSTGQFVARETVLGYTNQLIEAGGNASDVLADLYTSGTLSTDDFIDRLRSELKSTYIQEAVLGRGGRESMTPRDWGAVGAELKKQYALMEGFRADLKAGKLSEGQVNVRARMYFQTARQAFERANAAAHGVYDLPSYPGEENQTCYGGCHCHWEFEEVTDANSVVTEVRAYWKLDAEAEHCEPDAGTRGCVQNSVEYNPYVISMVAEVQ